MQRPRRGRDCGPTWRDGLCAVLGRGGRSSATGDDSGRRYWVSLRFLEGRAPARPEDDREVVPPKQPQRTLDLPASRLALGAGFHKKEARRLPKKAHLWGLSRQTHTFLSLNKR